MEEMKIKLSGLWVSLMLTYLLGDVLRIFSGDFQAGEIEGVQVTHGMYLGLSILMVVPVVMVFLSLVLKHRANRWANIIVASFFFVFNLIGLPGYPSAYDQFLILVGLVFNVLTVWYAWRWVLERQSGNQPLERPAAGFAQGRAIERKSGGSS